MLLVHERHEKVTKFILDLYRRGYCDCLSKLAIRWKDEHTYEDIQGYQDIIKKNFPELDIVEMRKRPFGVVFKCFDVKLLTKCLFKGNNIVVKTGGLR